MAKLRGHCSFRYHLILIVTSISSTSSCSSSSSSSSVPVRSPKRHILQNLGPHMYVVRPLDNARHAPCIAQSLLFIGKTFALFPHGHASTLDLTQHHQHTICIYINNIYISPNIFTSPASKFLPINK